jgi:hypothetical protein
VSQHELAAPAVSDLTVAPSVSPGLGYPNNRIDAPVAPTGWQPIQDKNLMAVGNYAQASASAAEVRS